MRGEGRRQGERVAQGPDQSTSHNQQQQQPPLSQGPLGNAAPGCARDDEPQSLDRQLLRKGAHDRVGTALQFLSPLGGEAAIQQPRSSFEAK